MASAWVMIFGAAFIVFALGDEFRALGRRIITGANPEAGVVSGSTLHVPMAADGHFWVRGSVNGVPTRFLIDSGATTTALSSATASAAAITHDSGFPVLLSTANGEVRADRATIDRLVIGPMQLDNVAAVTAPEFGDQNVLGMNFLSSLRSWGVEHRTLVLQP
ncbi:MAG: TIGR02281 family clan AA aspartic protease [Zymomonas sp.]|nr:MAG: TIGR02281 family clan AA aspartic protease [Zymomonas sp.]